MVGAFGVGGGGVCGAGGGLAEFEEGGGDGESGGVADDAEEVGAPGLGEEGGGQEVVTYRRQCH